MHCYVVVLFNKQATGKSKMQLLESLPGQENVIILPQFYNLYTGYLLSSVSVTKYYYLPAMLIFLYLLLCFCHRKGILR